MKYGMNMKRTKSNNTYSTTDTPLAAYLIIEGFPLQSITYEGKRAIFHFEKNVMNSVRLYMSGDAIVNLSKYEYTRKQLLNQINRWHDNGGNRQIAPARY